MGAHVVRSSNVLKRARVQLMQDARGGVQSRYPKDPLPTSAGKPSSSTLAQIPEIEVIDDSDLNLKMIIAKLKRFLTPNQMPRDIIVGSNGS